MSAAFSCKIGDILQVKPWGVRAFHASPEGEAYIRLEWGQVEHTGGHAPFMPSDEPPK